MYSQTSLAVSLFSPWNCPVAQRWSLRSGINFRRICSILPRCLCFSLKQNNSNNIFSRRAFLLSLAQDRHQIHRCGTGVVQLHIISSCAQQMHQNLLRRCCVSAKRICQKGLLLHSPLLDYETSTALIEMQYCNIGTSTHNQPVQPDICGSTAVKRLWRFGEVTLLCAPSPPAGCIDRFHSQRHM